MATALPYPTEARNVLYEIPWNTYLALRDNPENYHLHMTYDEGTLEIMSPSPHHEGLAHIISLIISVWAEELDIPIRGLREMSCKRADLEKGLEPDNCYYIQNERKLRNILAIDLVVDPPPDLAVEIEVSRSSVKKMPIYAALGICELWRYDGQILRVYELVESLYQSRETSACFPAFPVDKVEEILQQLGKVDDTSLVREFRRWVRENAM